MRVRPPPVGTSPVPTYRVASGPLVVRPAFTATMSIAGAPVPPPPPPVPKVPTHGIVLDQQGPVPVAAPVTVRIPAHDVVSRVVPVGVDQGTGELTVPADPAQVGWYQFGATPGAAGAAVLAGHVDWKGRPGAFIHLDEVQPGERIEVDLGDGTSHALPVVAETHLILKTELPADLFARTGPPRLVLITCGGEFDRSRPPLQAERGRRGHPGRLSHRTAGARRLPGRGQLSGRSSPTLSCAAPGSRARRGRRGRRRAGRAHARRGCCA